MYQVAITGGDTHTVSINGEELSVNDEVLKLDVLKQGNHSHVLWNNKGYAVELVEVDHEAKTITLKVNGQQVTATIKTETDLLLEKLGMNTGAKAGNLVIKAPMPGLVLKVLVEPGQSVSKGEPVLVLEAMKMENVLKAPADAVVKEVKVTPGVKVDKNQVLLSF